MRQNNRLVLRDLGYWVKLGCTSKEIRKPQEVRLTFELQFPKRPLACKTDRLEDTICYDHLGQLIAASLKGKSFRTIEYLAFYFFKLLRKEIPRSIKLKVTLHKVNPPMAHLKGGSFFTTGDLCE